MGALHAPKTPGSGRKPGTPNKRSTLDVHGKLAAANVDLVTDILADIEKILDPVERAAARLKLLEYCAPKLKAVELSGDLGQATPVTEDNVNELWERARLRAISGGAGVG
jgi:hypothetical protein